MTLKEKFPDIDFMTPKDAMDSLGWEYVYDKESENLHNIHCCGDAVEIVGIIGVDYAICSHCGKLLQDITGLHRTGNAVVGMIDLSDVDLSAEKNKIWYCPKTIKG